jgi:hypothetical protein
MRRAANIIGEQIAAAMDAGGAKIVSIDRKKIAGA